MLQNVAHAFFETNTKKTKDLLEPSDKLNTLAEAFPDVLRKRDLERPSIGFAFFFETLKYQGILVFPEMRLSNKIFPQRRGFPWTGTTWES